MFGQGRRDLINLRDTVMRFGTVPDRAVAFHAECKAVVAQIDENLGVSSYLFVGAFERQEIKARVDGLVDVAPPLGKLCNDAEALQSRISGLEREAIERELTPLLSVLAGWRASCRQLGGRCSTAGQVRGAIREMAPIEEGVGVLREAIKLVERADRLLQDHRRWETSIVKEAFRDEVRAFEALTGEPSLGEIEIRRFRARIVEQEAAQLPAHGLTNSDIHRLLNEALAWSEWLLDSEAAAEYGRKANTILRAGGDDPAGWQVSGDLEQEVVALRQRATEGARERLGRLLSAGRLAQQAVPSIDASLARELAVLGDPQTDTPKLLEEWSAQLAVQENRFETRIVNHGSELVEFLRSQGDHLRRRVDRILLGPHDQSTRVRLDDIKARFSSIQEVADSAQIVSGLQRAAGFSEELDEIEATLAGMLEPLQTRERSLAAIRDAYVRAFSVLGPSAPTPPDGLPAQTSSGLAERGYQLTEWESALEDYRYAALLALEHEHDAVRRSVRAWRSALRTLGVTPPLIELPVPCDDALESSLRLIQAFEVRDVIAACLEAHAESVRARLDDVTEQVDDLLSQPQLPEDCAELGVAQQHLLRWAGETPLASAAELAAALDGVGEASAALNRLLATERGIDRERTELETRLSDLRRADLSHQFGFHIERASALLHGLQVMSSNWDLQSREVQKDRCAEIVQALEAAIELDARTG